MFTIDKAQLDLFRIPNRAARRNELTLTLLASAGQTVSQSDDTVVLENARGATSRLAYSPANLLSRFQKPSGASSSFSYDEEDRIDTIQFSGGNEALKFAYKDDQASMLALNAARFGFRYDDPDGNLTEIMYPDQRAVRLRYENHQLAAIFNRANEEQHYSSTLEHDQLVHRFTDPLGRVTTIRMGEAAALREIELPDKSSFKIDFDEDEQCETITLRNGSTRTTWFDDMFSRRVKWEDGHYQNIETNAEQMILSLENQSGSLSYEYDAAGRMLSERFDDRSLRLGYTQELLTQMSYPGGMEVAYGYDEDDRLASVSVDGEVCRFVYAANGTLSEIQFPNGLTERQQNTVLGRTTEAVLQRNDGAFVSRSNYRYDILGRLTGATLQRNGAPEIREYAYDDGDRLLQIRDGSGRATESFQYDRSGSLSKIGQDAVVIGVMDEVLKIGRNGIRYSRAGNITGFSDAAGRELSLKYAHDGTMSSARIGTELWRYEYDGLGRRVLKTNGRETVRFFWSGDRLLSEDTDTGAESTSREYIYAGTDVPIAFREAGVLYWLHSDVRGAVTHVYDSRGNLVWQASYTAFGAATIQLEKIRQPWRLAGQYFDAETGLHYNLARYYSPYLHSFLSLDPRWLEYGVGNYSYAGNDPYNRIDTNGQMPGWLSTTLAVGAGIAVGVAIGIAAAAIAPAACATLLGVVVVGAIAGAVGGAVEPIVKSLLDNKPICWPCVMKSALMGAALGAILGPVAKVLGKALAPLARKIMPKVIKAFPNQTMAVRRALNKVTGAPARAAGEKTDRFAERAIRQKLAKEGFEEVKVQNASNQGVDIIAHNPKTGQVKVIEVKSTTVSKNYYNGNPEPKNLPLSTPQKNPATFTQDRLAKAASGTGRYAHPPELSANAKQAQRLIRSAETKGTLQYEKYEVFLDERGNLIDTISKPW